MKNLFQKLAKDESGASLIEYVLIAAVVSIGSIAVMRTTNTDIQGIWKSVSGILTAP